MAFQAANTPAVGMPVRSMGPGVVPNRLYIRAPGLNHHKTRMLAFQAAAQARLLAPKLSGRAAQGIKPYWGNGYFGVKWDRPYLWQQESGIGAFTMRSLAGKTIPMWIDDPTGQEHQANPKAPTRITESGRRQVLIFRKAAKIGARKRVAVRDTSGRLVRWREVPASYPGAPGRITHREFDERRNQHTGRIARLVARPHVGVRWRHPGLVGREFMQYSLQYVAGLAGIEDQTVYALYARS
jgi:hypothetical protein